MGTVSEGLGEEVDGKKEVIFVDWLAFLRVCVDIVSVVVEKSIVICRPGRGVAEFRCGWRCGKRSVS